jgi:hypothetical protein
MDERLVGDLLRFIARLLPSEDVLCLRLACTTIYWHLDQPAARSRRTAFLRTQARAAFACELRGFMLANTTEMLVLAAREGNADVLAELADVRGCVLDLRVCSAAAAEGRMEALVWLRARGCQWGGDTCARAARGGHLRVLRYAHEHGCPWNSSTCYEAARGGHLEVLRYAHEHGCPWDWFTCSGAARGGHDEVLRYAHENGCPWDQHTRHVSLSSRNTQ